VSEALRVLAAPTPPEWVDSACAHWRTLLIDHANCEKKAASSALALIFAYPEDADLVTALSRLGREELRHFEQVAQLMRQLEVPFERQRPGRYAAGLRAVLRSHEPLRKLDLLLSSALIEAPPLGGFYDSLRRSEARHFELYLRLARRASGDEALCERRLRQLAAVEAELITAPDEVLRFHSGPAAALPA
jgi:tRNA-(ms[2]io[6]A)-hydroxylase